MLLNTFVYLSLLLFIAFSVSKAVKLAKMPLHGRWELYPVPAEKDKGHYGGSYYEEVKWYEKPHQVSHLAEIVDMAKEILFIKKLFDNQRPLWWLSYSLHLGIYLTIFWLFLLAAGSFVPAGGAWDLFFYGMIVYFGILSIILVLLGSFGLLLKRIFTPTLRIYTTPQEYFNLIFLGSVALTALLNWLGNRGFENVRAFASGLLHFQPVEVSGLFLLNLLLFGLVIIYIPLTKMSHYVGKFFSFHKVLWDNEPFLPGNEVAAKVKAGMAFKGTKSWSAPHYPGNKKEGE